MPDADAVVSSDATLILRFDDPLDAARRRMVGASGVQFVEALGGGSYRIRVPQSYDMNELQRLGRSLGVRSVGPRTRLHPRLTARRPPSWARVPGPDARHERIAVYVLCANEQDSAIAQARVRRSGGRVRSSIAIINAFVAEVPTEVLDELGRMESVQWVEPALPKLEGVNDDNRGLTQADIVQEPPFSLDGSGIDVMIYDGGLAEGSHPDLDGRVWPGDDSTAHFHATHIAGTIGGSGVMSAGELRGLAPAVTLHSYSFQFDIHGGNLQVLYSNPGDLAEDYAHAVNQRHVVLANNSIGSNVCANAQVFDCDVTGNYGVTSRLVDSLVIGAAGAPLTVVWAAGNERACSTCTGQGGADEAGYGSMPPPAGSKNAIVVGAVHADTDTVTEFSSWGPTDDGRVKPDVVAPGCQILGDQGVSSTCTTSGPGALPECSAVGPDESCCDPVDGTFGYSALCGTSMAAPTVTGAAALLLQDLADQSPARLEPAPATLKSLLIHTAADIEAVGPDYRSGYGSVRIAEAIEFARTGHFLEWVVDHAGTAHFFVNVLDDGSSLAVTLAWDDPPGFPGAAQALINDLDVRVISPQGQVHYPWTLDPEAPSDPAVTSGPDRQNNVERVTIEQPVAGLWRVEVVGHAVPLGPQAFSLCATPALARDCNGDAIPDDEQISANPELDCTGNGILDSCESDCNDNGVADTCDIHNGTSTDCDGNITPDECETGGMSDCDTDGISDLCELAEGLDGDCNDNAVPDTCEWGGAVDCNVNGTPDLCDIHDATSEDFNSNGVPDECEAEQRTIHVNQTACPGPGSGDADDPFCQIQDGIMEAISGDIVLVAPGTYVGAGNRGLNGNGRTFTVRCAGEPGACVLDAQDQHRLFTFENGESRDTLVEGFEMRNGQAIDGGALLFREGSSPTLRQCLITASSATGSFGGGGAHIDRSAPLFEQCQFIANSAVWDGGAAYIIESQPDFMDTVVALNVAQNGHGGALYIAGQSHVRCTDGRLHNNHTLGVLRHGGAVYCFHASLEMHGCRIGAHTSRGCGGAVYSWLSDIELTNSTLINNAAIPVEGASGCGGALFSNTGSAVLRNCSVLNNSARNGGGLYATGSGTVTARNTVMWDNVAEAGPQAYLSAFVDMIVRHCDVAGGANHITQATQSTVQWLGGNIDVEPSFLGDVTGAYAPQATSALVDAGDPFYVIAQGEQDVDGRLRVQGTAVDIGAAEFDPFDCNRNMQPDDEEVAGGADDCNANLVPDDCELDCNGNDLPDDCDIAFGLSADCDTNGVPDDCAATEQDCDHDFVPDLCAIATGVVPDCNNNDRPDECDLDDGAEDFNANGVPDECELPIRGWVVDDDAPGDPLPGSSSASDPQEDGSSAHPFDSIQEAIDVALSGDTIRVRPGVYVGPSNRALDFGGRLITLRGAGAAETILDAEGHDPLFNFHSGETSDAVVDGLTLRGGEGAGGAIVCWAQSRPTIRRCRLFGNTGTTGGAVSCWGGAAPMFEHCEISGNVSPNAAGAIFLTGASCALRHCTIAGNMSGLDSAGVVTVQQGTIDVTGTILWGNATPDDIQIALQDGTAIVRYSALPSGQLAISAIGASTVTWGIGNTRHPPMFVDVAHGNYHLLPGSPLIGAGPPDHGFAKTVTDIDGDPRVMAGSMEVGADEVDPDCNHNGVLDAQDIAAGALDCNANGLPDDCEDCDDDGVADACAIADGALDCNDNGQPDVCDPGGLDDCDDDGLTDACELAAGLAPDCNANGIPDHCDSEVDCNSNGQPDDCDVADGISEDCNHNDIPDICDLSGESQDCDGNTVPDECDPDCNSNEVPDTCDLQNGAGADCDHDGLLDECESDCDGSGEADVCEILEGLKPDCNLNGTIDTCDPGWGLDCDGNGTTDFCDVANGQLDLNANGVPDTCEPTIIVYVSDDACPGPGDGSQASPFCRIQDALDAAPTGIEAVVEVRVAAGLYAGPSNRDLRFGGKSIALSCVDTGSCVIDAQGEARVLVFDGGETRGASVRGFELTGGAATKGGAILCTSSSPVIHECTIAGNIATTLSGGGIHSEGGSPLITHCVIADNVAMLHGGGLFCAGGAVQLHRCHIASNLAGASGGGVIALAGAHTIRNTVIRGNTASGLGGGVYVRSGAALTASGLTIVANSAAQGGGILAETSALMMQNSILWSNTAADGSQCAVGPASEVTITFSDSQGGPADVPVADGSVLDWAAGNLNIDPGFEPDGYHLGGDSPCIDAGDPDFSPGLLEVDIDGADRVQDGRVDIGAHEVAP
jgi:hypothetical protein